MTDQSRAGSNIERFPSRPAPEQHRHPALGLAPLDMTAGFPMAAERLRVGRRRLAGRALEAALDIDPSIAARYDELGLRRLLRDTEVLIDRLSRAVASGDPLWMRVWAEQAAPVYRRRGVPLSDVVSLCDGLHDAASALLAPDERAALERAIDGAATVFEWNARLAGDARKHNPLLNLLYRGA